MESLPPLPDARRLIEAVVPVLVVDDVQAASPLADVLVETGLRLRRGDPAHGSRPAASCAGCPTVPSCASVPAPCWNPQQVDQAVQAGARFIVSPGLDPRVVERCLDLGVLVLPGVATASEILRARRYGLSAVKFFPAEQAGGVPALRSLASAIPDIGFMPTGGIVPDNAGAYLDEPSVLGGRRRAGWPRGASSPGARGIEIRPLCAHAARLAATHAGRQSA